VSRTISLGGVTLYHRWLCCFCKDF